MFKMNFDTGYLGIGQAWADYDNDGLPDLYVTGNLTASVLFHNDGDGTFSVPPAAADVRLPNTLTGGTVWADYDNDGWRDLYVLAHGANVLFHNAGRRLQRCHRVAGVGDTGKGSTAAWGDYDRDGYLDLYVTNWSCFPECDPIDPRPRMCSTTTTAMAPLPMSPTCWSTRSCRAPVLPSASSTTTTTAMWTSTSSTMRS